MHSRARILVLLLLIATTVGCDRVTKRLAMTSLAGEADRSYFGNTIRLEYAENTGGFLSLGANLSAPARTAVFVVATGLLMLILLVAGLRYARSLWHLAGVALAFAGGASNLIDRISRGSVIDFLNVGIGPFRTGVFNVADIAILAGMLLLIKTHAE